MSSLAEQVKAQMKVAEDARLRALARGDMKLAAKWRTQHQKLAAQYAKLAK